MTTIKKELAVAALENGTVIDRIPSEQLFKVVSMLKLDTIPNSITIGNNVNIQDGAVVHTLYQRSKSTIGNNVSIGHNATIHGATIEDNCLIGMGAIVLDNAVVLNVDLVQAGVGGTDSWSQYARPYDQYRLLQKHYTYSFTFEPLK